MQTTQQKLTAGRTTSQRTLNGAKKLAIRAMKMKKNKSYAVETALEAWEESKPKIKRFVKSNWKSIAVVTAVAVIGAGAYTLRGQTKSNGRRRVVA